MKINLKLSFFFLWSSLFTLSFFVKSLRTDNGEAFILRFLGFLGLTLLYGFFGGLAVSFNKEKIRIFRGIFVLLALSLYLEYYIFYLPLGFLTEGILNIVIEALPMVLLCCMAWEIEYMLSIVLQNIYRKQNSIYTLWNKQLIHLTEDSERKKETVFPAFSILSIVFSLVLLYFLMENSFALWLASFSAVLSIYFPQCMLEGKIKWKPCVLYSCLAILLLSFAFIYLQMQENYFSFSFVLGFIVEQILGILAAVVIIKLLQKNGENSFRIEGTFPKDVATIENL